MDKIEKFNAILESKKDVLKDNEASRQAYAHMGATQFGLPYTEADKMVRDKAREANPDYMKNYEETYPER